MKLRDLFVSIGFDVKDDALKKLDDGLNQTKTLITALGAAAVASAGLLYGIAKSVADVGDRAAKTADKLGVQIEALQELRYAAELSGIAQGNFDTALQRVTRRAAEAARGTGEAKDALRELGVEVTDSRGRLRSAEDLLGDIADGMSVIDDQGRRVALAFKLFDTEGVGMVNMLAKGGDNLRRMREEARRLGLVISEQTARDSERFQDELLRSKSILAGIKNQVGADLLPVFIDLMIQFRKWVAINRELIKSGVGKVLRGAIALMRGLYKIGREVVRILGEMVEMFGGIERVATAAAWAVGLFASFQVISTIGAVTKGVMKLTTAIRAMGNAALLANLKAGLIVVASVLAIQDILSYLQGKDSITGVIIKWLREDLPPAIDFATAYLKQKMDELYKYLEDQFPESVKRVMKFLKFTEPLSLGALNEMDVSKIDRSKIPDISLSGLKDKFIHAMRLHHELVYGPNMMPAHATPSPSVSISAPINAPMTINVPEGTRPEDVHGAVSEGVRKAIDDRLCLMLREASEATDLHVTH